MCEPISFQEIFFCIYSWHKNVELFFLVQIPRIDYNTSRDFVKTKMIVHVISCRVLWPTLI